MKLLLLIMMSFLFVACSTTTTTPAFTKQQEQESKALGVLSNYTGAVLAAAALPLQYYCQHQHWPVPQSIDITQATVSNLSGLYYTPTRSGLYQANFSLIDQANENAQTITNWRIVIPKINTSNTGVQKVNLEIINDDFNVHLSNVMDFQCMKAEASNVNKTKVQSNKAK